MLSVWELYLHSDSRKYKLEAQIKEVCLIETHSLGTETLFLLFAEFLQLLKDDSSTKNLKIIMFKTGWFRYKDSWGCLCNIKLYCPQFDSRNVINISTHACCFAVIYTNLSNCFIFSLLPIAKTLRNMLASRLLSATHEVKAIQDTRPYQNRSG